MPYHSFLCMKMPGPQGIIKVQGDQQLARLIELGRAPGQRVVNQLEGEMEKRTNPQTPEPLESEASMPPMTTRFVLKATPEGEVKTLPLRDQQPEKKVQTVADLPTQLREDLMKLLCEYEDVFAWSPKDL